MALAAGLGFVAVQQLVAGRQSMQQGASALKEDRNARDQAKEAQIQAVLKSLQLEIHRNRLAALAQEHRLELIGAGQRVGFSTRMADALASGALWALADEDSILDLVGQAYADSADLVSAVSPIRWLPVVLSGFALAS